jgi:hypothetical protein
VRIRVPAPAAPDIAVLADVEDPSFLDQAAKALAVETRRARRRGRLGRCRRGRARGADPRRGGALPAAALRPRLITFGTRFAAGELAASDLVLRPRVVDWDRKSPYWPISTCPSSSWAAASCGASASPARS